jgi:hypothetical protein
MKPGSKTRSPRFSSSSARELGPIDGSLSSLKAVAGIELLVML